ncbi:MAG: phosphoribosylglycinamide formyltransferase [Candidatus Zixiibacteriota bacterium]|nr:MAG: phosphoribosylglycinamide formyltransferase [candidate division Zixibacteria bacterium]
MPKLSIAVFASGGGTNLQSLINSSNKGVFDGDIAAVISNNSGAFALERAKKAGIAAYHISGKKYPGRNQFVGEILKTLENNKANLIVLAGYMKLLPLEVVRIFRNRILNIHPALLPKYGGKGMYGMNVHKAVIESGDKISGATVHFVDEIFDHGVILIQRTVPVLPGDDPETLAARVLKVEHKILPEAVSMFA